MKRPMLTGLIALTALALMAPRPSINELNTRVNQLEADQNRQDSEIAALTPGLQVFDADGNPLGSFISAVLGGRLVSSNLWALVDGVGLVNYENRALSAETSEGLPIPQGVYVVVSHFDPFYFLDSTCEGAPYTHADLAGALFANNCTWDDCGKVEFYAGRITPAEEYGGGDYYFIHPDFGCSSPPTAVALVPIDAITVPTAWTATPPVPPGVGGTEILLGPIGPMPAYVAPSPQ